LPGWGIDARGTARLAADASATRRGDDPDAVPEQIVTLAQSGAVEAHTASHAHLAGMDYESQGRRLRKT
jgi:hypothetical protein